MRYIRTTNNQIEFIEANDEGKILTSIGLQLGEVYFQIKNGKVSFYLNDSERPFDNFIWTINIPFELDGVVYDNEDDASAVLHNIMNDRFQEQLDELKEGLAAEEARAQEAEAQLDDKIDDESARAIAAENRLQDQVTELSGTVATFDGRITKNTNDISALTVTVNDEIARSVGKDAQHDAEISGLTNSINTEISRALSAETQLHNEIINEQNRAIAKENALDSKIDLEIANRIADVDAEETRALAAEQALDSKIDNEITRSTAKDTEHDTLISGLTDDLASEIARATARENQIDAKLDNEIVRATNAENALDDKIDLEIRNRINAVSGLTERVADDEASTGAALVDLNNKINAVSGENASQSVQISGLTNSINTEISRATSVENSLRNDLNSEISARTSADAAQLQRITALEVGKADANNVYTKAESDAKYATKEYISGMTDNFYTKGQTNELLAAKADKVSAVASAAYNSTNKTIDFKNISGTVISSVDARDFIKDGMVDNVEIVNNNLVITFNTDAGKEAITVPLTSIFDPTNYYTKSEVNSALSAKADTSLVETISGNVVTLSGDVQTLNEKVETLSGESVTSGEVESMINEAVSGKADKTEIYTYVGTDRIKVTNTTGIRRKAIDLNLPIYRGSGTESLSLGAPIGTLQGANQINGYFSTGIGLGLTTNNSSEVATGQYNISHTVGATSWGNSGNTLFSIGNGGHQGDEHNAFEVRQNGDIYISSGGTATSSMIKLQDHLGGGGSEPVDAYTKAESDAKFATITNFNSHSGNTTMHVTSSEKATWNAKADASNVYSKTEVDNKLSAKPNVWCGNESEWSQISGSTESGTIYLVY